MRTKVIVLAFIFISLLVISVSANVYSFNKLSNKESEINKKNTVLLEKKEDEILSLKDEISTLNNQLKSQNETSENNNTGNSNESNSEANSLPNTSMENLVNTAYRFVDYTYNVNSENYATAKQNASNYMTDELVETLFSSDGIDDSKFKLTTKVKDIEVYLNSKNDKQAIVNYNVEMDFGNGYEEKLNEFNLLYFVEEDGVYKVKKIEAINNIGGI